jgi:mRNA interferase MazF
MREGALVLVPFPFTDLSGQKVRPALMLHVSRGEDCIVAFVSSDASRKIAPFHVIVPTTTKNGLKVDSVVRVDKLATLQKKIILGEIGVLEDGARQKIKQEIRKLFKL